MSTVVVAAALVAVGTRFLAPASMLVPAGSPEGSQALALPENVWPAKSWYPTSDEDDPPGTVAVLGGLIRGDRDGLFTVSAETGAYRLLDLPDVAELEGDVAALSPDGRHIAYWLKGKTSGTPFGDSHSDVPVGVGVFDTESGEVERYLPATEHGISADGLVWIDNGFLALSYGQRTSPSAAADIAVHVWRPFSESTGLFEEPTRGRSGLFFDGIRSRDGGILGQAAPGRFGHVSWDGSISTEPTLRFPKLDQAEYVEAAVSGPHVVAVVRDQLGDFLGAGRREPDGQVRDFDVIEGLEESAQLVGWLADDRVLVLGNAPASAPDEREYAALLAIDLSDGRITRLGTAEGGMYGQGLSFASDLLANPMVQGQRPPTVDPRWTWGGGAAALVLVLGLVLPLVHRRRRG